MTSLLDHAARRTLGHDFDFAITPGGRVGDASPLGTGKRKLSDYEREVAHALMRKGHDKRTAIRIARGVIQRAAATGRWGRGKAKPNVVAGAAASIAQRKAFSVAHKLSNDGTDDIALDWTKFDTARKGKSRVVARAISRTKVDAPKVLKKRHTRQAHLAARAQREQARRIARGVIQRAGKLTPLSTGAHKEDFTESKFRPNLRNRVSGFANDPALDLKLGVFDEALHPRGPDGKWIPKGTAKYKSAVAAVRAAQRQHDTRLAKQILAGKAGPAARAVKVKEARLGKKRALVRAVAVDAKGKPVRSKVFEQHYEHHVAHIDSMLSGDKLKHLRSEEQHATLHVSSKGEKSYIFDRKRRVLQRKIVNDVLQREIAKGARKEHKALLLGGLPGSGKTTALKEKIPGMNLSHYVVVNPDIFKEEMAKRGLVPKVKGLSPMEASSLNHEESATMALMLAEAARQRGLNVVWDITMNSEGSVDKRLTPLKKSGYRAQAVFVDFPHERSATSVRQRHRNGYIRQLEGKTAKDKLGQRFVPSSHTKSGKSDKGSSSANRDAFDAVKSRFAAYKLYNNHDPADPTAYPMREIESNGSFKP